MIFSSTAAAVPLGWYLLSLAFGVAALALCWYRSVRMARSLQSQTEAYHASLREQDSLYKDLIERAGDGIVIVQNGLIVQANRRVLEFSGCQREEVLGVSFTRFIPSDELAKVGEYYSRRMRGDEAPSVYETKLLHKSGSILDVEISGGLVPMRGGMADLVLIRDITERIRKDTHLREYSHQLESANSQLQAAINRTNELAAKAEAANRSKTDFLSNMSHELRTPLTTIMGMTELLRDGAFGSLQDKQAEGLATIDASSQHLLDLINDILDIAKLESGRVDLERRPVEIRALCSTCISFMQEAANRKGIALSVDCAGAPQKFWADGRRLRQILINVLGNAVKFTPEGGSVGLVASSLAGGAGVQFTIWDTGVGIPKDKLEKIFLPFEQVSQGEASRPGGTGLGLALVKRLVSLHGGTLQVRSDLGQGSQFIIAIPDPVARMNASSLPQSGTSSATALKGSRILIAEDEATNASILQFQLERRGAQVMVVGNGQLALEAAGSWKPDLLLMDIQMPVLNGLEATKLLKADTQLRHVPVICLTAFASEQDKRNCLSHGADDYLPKPVDMNALVVKIQQLLPAHMNSPSL